MSSDGVEIATHRLHIHRHMHRALAAIDTDRNPPLPRRAADRGHIHHRAGDVRHLRNRHKPRPWPDGVDHRLRVQHAVLVAVHPFQHHALPFAQKVPGHDVGVMLHHRQDDLIPRLKARRGPGIGHKVQPLGRAGGEHDLLGVAGVEEAGNDAAHAFILFGRKVRKVVQATVNIGIFHRIGLVHRLNHHLRLLRAGAVVQIDQRLAIDLPRQDREIGADLGDIIHWQLLRRRPAPPA